MSESDNEAIVQFKWQYQLNAAGEEIKKHIETAALDQLIYGFEPAGVRSGTALFRRYDDGWRVESVGMEQ